MKLFLTIIFSIFSTSLFAQPEGFVALSNSECAEFKHNMLSVTQKTKSLSSGFIQRKYVSVLADVAESSGIMVFNAPSNLQWEYIKPSAFAFILDNGNARVSNAQGEVEMPAQAKKMIGSLSELILNMVSGSFLTDKKAFDAEFLGSKNDVAIRLTPKVARIKKMFSEIVVYVDRSTLVASSIEIREKNGDRTVIILTNPKVDLN